MTGLLHYVLLLLCFLIIDAVWIGLVANAFYKREIGTLLLAKPKFVPAGIFYAAYVFGMLYLIIDPMVAANADMLELIVRAAVFGGVMYATYDLTNLSTLKGWSAKMAVVDIAWGMVLTTLVSLFGFMIFSR